MNINWTAQQIKVIEGINALGTDIYWLQRIESGSDAYVTGSTTTYGYGDLTIHFVTGSTKALISHVSAQEQMTILGHYDEDIDRFFVDPTSAVTSWDQIIISGSNIKYLVLAPHIFTVGAAGLTISKSFLARKIFPKSGSGAN